VTSRYIRRNAIIFKILKPKSNPQVDFTQTDAGMLLQSWGNTTKKHLESTYIYEIMLSEHSNYPSYKGIDVLTAGGGKDDQA